MAKRLLTVIAMLLVTVMATGLVGCNKKGGGKTAGENGTITISYYKGGTGSAWMEELAAAFEADTGIAVDYEHDNNITTNAQTLLESQRNVPDLMFIQYTTWQEWVQKGWVSPLTDLYDGSFSYTVDDFTISSKYSIENTKTQMYLNESAVAKNVDASSVTISDILVEDFKDYGLMAKTVNDDPEYYVVPWNCPSTGLAYNVDLLKRAGWDNPPATESELKECIEDLKAIGADIFAWGGTEMKYWNFVVLTWWAQYEGVENMRKFYDFENPEVFLQQGRTEALQLWQELLVDPTTGDWINSITKPMGRDHLDAEKVFAAGNTAFTVTGAWLENEVGKYIEGWEYKMMPVPMIDGAKAEKNVLNTEAGAFAMIPELATNKEQAKAFLAYMNQPEWIEKFSQTSRQLRPFNYYPSKLDNLSTYNKSVFELYETSERMWRISDTNMFIYAGISEWPYYGAASLYTSLAGDKKVSVSAVIDKMYTYADKNWATWKKVAGV